MVSKDREAEAVLDSEAANKIFQQVHEMWIAPEVARREAAGTLPTDFKIYSCLIRLPRGREPIVEFNDEIGWVAKATWEDSASYQSGMPIYLHNLQVIESVEPPEVDGERVAFVFLYWTGLEYRLLSDFTPNWDEHQLPDGAHDWRFGELIGSYLHSLFTERVINTHDAVVEKLHAVGLWAAPALLPYPLSKIIVQLDVGDVAGARSTLVSYCTPTFIKQLVEQW